MLLMPIRWASVHASRWMGERTWTHKKTNTQTTVMYLALKTARTHSLEMSSVVTCFHNPVHEITLSHTNTHNSPESGRASVHTYMLQGGWAGIGEWAGVGEGRQTHRLL